MASCHFLVKTLAVLFLMAILQTLLTRLRIDQTVGMWWRFGSILVLAQILLTIIIERESPMKIGTMFKDIIDFFLQNPPRSSIPPNESRLPNAIAAFFLLIHLRAPAAVYALRIARRMPSSWSSWTAPPKGMW